jgi:hypothetical protein
VGVGWRLTSLVSQRSFASTTGVSSKLAI